MLECHCQIFLWTLIRIRKIPLKCSCWDLVSDAMEGFISTSAEFQPRRGILVMCENETLKFYLSSYLFLRHPCGERRKQFSQLLLWTFSFTDSKLMECVPACLLTEISHTKLAHSKSLLLLSAMKLQCPSQWYRISSWNGLKAIWKCGILYEFILSFYLKWFSNYFWESNRGTWMCYIREDNICGTGDAPRWYSAITLSTVS